MMSKKQLISLFMCGILLLSVSCGGGAPHDTGSDSGEGTDNTSDTTAPVVEEGYDYPDVDYEGYKFRILNFDEHHGSYMNLDFEQATGEKLDDAVYDRNRKVEEKLNFELVEIEEHYANWAADQTALIEKLTNSVLADDDEFDAAYIQPHFKPSVITDGTLLDMATVPELKLDEEYWDRVLNESYNLNGKQFVASGPLHLMSVELCWCLLFNEELMEDYKLEKPYQLVRDGKWTIDKLNEYAAASANLNGDESFSFSEDGEAVYGIAASSAVIPAFMYSSGHRFVAAEGDGFAVNLTSERLDSCVEKLINLFDQDSGKVRVNGDDSAVGGYIDLFRTNRAMFITCEVKSTALLRDMEATYGLLPIPKYEESQDGYSAFTSASVSLLGIPATQSDPSRAGVILDALTYESYKSVLPLLYEVRIGQKGLRNEESIEMFELIRTTRGTEFARNLGVTATYVNVMMSMVEGGDNQLASYAAAHEASVKVALNKLLDGLNNK